MCISLNYNKAAYSMSYMFHIFNVNIYITQYTLPISLHLLGIRCDVVGGEHNLSSLPLNQSLQKVGKRWKVCESLKVQDLKLSPLMFTSLLRYYPHVMTSGCMEEGIQAQTKLQMFCHVFAADEGPWDLHLQWVKRLSVA